MKSHILRCPPFDPRTRRTTQPAALPKPHVPTDTGNDQLQKIDLQAGGTDGSSQLPLRSVMVTLALLSGSVGRETISLLRTRPADAYPTVYDFVCLFRREAVLRWAEGFPGFRSDFAFRNAAPPPPDDGHGIPPSQLSPPSRSQSTLVSCSHKPLLKMQAPNTPSSAKRATGRARPAARLAGCLARLGRAVFWVFAFFVPGLDAIENSFHKSSEARYTATRMMKPPHKVVPFHGSSRPPFSAKL